MIMIQRNNEYKIHLTSLSFTQKLFCFFTNIYLTCSEKKGERLHMQIMH